MRFVNGPDDGLVADTRSADPILANVASALGSALRDKAIGQPYYGVPMSLAIKLSSGAITPDELVTSGLAQPHAYRVTERNDYRPSALSWCLPTILSIRPTQVKFTRHGLTTRSSEQRLAAGLLSRSHVLRRPASVAELESVRRLRGPSSGRRTARRSTPASHRTIFCLDLVAPASHPTIFCLGFALRRPTRPSFAPVLRSGDLSDDLLPRICVTATCQTIFCPGFALRRPARPSFAPVLRHGVSSERPFPGCRRLTTRSSEQRLAVRLSPSSSLDLASLCR